MAALVPGPRSVGAAGAGASRNGVAMFTGIIRGFGRLAARAECGGDLRLDFDLGGVGIGPLALGDSVAVDGVCLTVAALSQTGFAADVSRESLATTTLGRLGEGARVNLEPAVRAGEPLGGHLVSGHVDAVGEVLERRRDARSWRIRYGAPTALLHYIAAKGSVAVDGVSLTVTTVGGAAFEVNLVPHTLAHTNLGERAPGAAVNLEVDQVARYLERLLATR